MPGRAADSVAARPAEPDAAATTVSAAAGREGAAAVVEAELD